MFAKYANHDGLPQAFCWLGNDYLDARQDDKAAQCYQYVIDNSPDSNAAMSSWAGIARVHIRRGDDQAAQGVIDKIIADFNDHPGLRQAVFGIGEEYYNKAFQYENQDQGEQGKASFRKAIVISERIIAELPESSFTPQAYILLGECLRRVDQHQDALESYQKVVSNWPDSEYAWYAHFLIGCIYEQLRDSGTVEGPLAYTQIKAAYERIVQDYPDCPAAGAAPEWLNYYVKPSQGGQK